MGIKKMEELRGCPLALALHEMREVLDQIKGGFKKTILGMKGLPSCLSIGWDGCMVM